MGVKWAIVINRQIEWYRGICPFSSLATEQKRTFLLHAVANTENKMETTQEEIYNGRLSEIRESLLYAAGGML